MGLADKFLRKEPIPIITDTTGNVIKSASVDNNLSIEDLDFLLQYLRNADLKGYQVEMFYNLVIKLQNQYIEQSKK
jgi:CO dehydrogenase/acetyl-CoA synthase epsilon subunit